MTRRAVFDESRLDAELAELLPPLPEPADTRVRADGRTSVKEAAVEAAVETPASAPGRVAPQGAGRAAVVAVRIPRPLYEAVVRDLLGPLIEKPSYAQVIAWTCTDHPEDVRAELHRITELSARAPRGRRIAADTVPLTPRFQPTELDTLDAVLRDVGGDATRTAAVVAALRVAVKHGLTTP